MPLFAFTTNVLKLCFQHGKSKRWLCIALVAVTMVGVLVTLSTQPLVFPALNLPLSRSPDPEFNEKDLCFYRSIRNPVVFYNRVMKTGSSTALKVFEKLAKRGGHFVYKHSKNFFERRLDASGVVKLTETLFKKRPKDKPFLFDRHVYFVNFTNYSLPMPVYINTFREPLSRLVSQYYFTRLVSQQTSGRYSESEREESFEACVLKEGSECLGAGVVGEQLEWFCGQAEVCKTPSPTSLVLAKANIARHHAVIGHTGDLAGYFRLLEQVLPQMFRGAGKVFGNNTVRVSKTDPRYKPPPPYIEELMKTKYLRYEYELYKFLLQAYRQLQLKACQLDC